MAKIIVKCGYMKKDGKNRSGFMQYIAKRDGVIKDIEFIGNKYVTLKQKSYIDSILNDNIKRLEEYKIYNENKTISNASELISKIEESNIHNSNNANLYMKYIAERPRVAKESSHGLFSDDDVNNLSKVLKEVENHNGIVWTAIVSLKREDATKVSFDQLSSWKNLIRSNRNELARALDIKEDNFMWYGAFHDEKHHPHIHLVMYSKDINEGYLKEKSINKIRSLFGNEIFKDELLHLYKEQTQTRDLIKRESITKIENNEIIEHKMIKLALRLKNTSGKKQYGYLSKGLKLMVDDIVTDVSEDRAIKELIDKWYRYKQQVNNVYSNNVIEIKNLNDLKEFRSIKNHIIKLALEIDVNNQVELKEDIKVDVKQQYQENDYNLPITYVKKERELNLGISFKLLCHVSNMIESSINNHHNQEYTDNKLLKEQNKKKINLGIKLGDR